MEEQRVKCPFAAGQALTASAKGMPVVDCAGTTVVVE